MTSSVKDLRVLVDNLDEYIRIPGGVDRLKKMILHLAVSGQLVPQDAGEGTGEQLYEQIREVYKPKKSLPEVDVAPFTIPMSWRWTRLGDLFDITSSRRVMQADWKSSGIPFLRARDLANAVKTGRIEAEVFVSEEYYGEVAKSSGVPVPGDIMVSGVGTIGIPYIVKISDRFYFKDATILWFRNPAKVLADFVEIVFHAEFMKNVIISQSQGTTVSTYTIADARLNMMPLPPLAEQERIIEKRDVLFALIDDLSKKYAEEEARRKKLIGSLLGAFSDKNNSKALELLSELVRSKEDIWWLRNFILHQAVSGRLTQSDPSSEGVQVLYERALLERAKVQSGSHKPLPIIEKHEGDYELPDTWRWARLGEVTNYGKTEKRKPVDISEETWLLELEDIEKNSSKLISKVTANERNPSSDKNIFRKGDVLYGKLRPYLDKVIVADTDGVCSSEILPIRAYGDSIHPEYLLLVMKSPNFVATVNEMTYGVKMPRLGTEDGRKMLIPLAPYAEQLEIVERTKRLLSLVAMLESVFDSPCIPIERVLVKDNRWWFALKQGIGSVLDKLSKTQYERGEMVIAKYMYLLQEVYKVPFGLQFVKHQFGPYDPDIKKAILGSSFNKDKFFTVKGSGVKQVYSLGMKSDTLMKYSSDILTSAQSSLDELMQYTANAKSRDIERLATVCKIIQDSQSNDERVVINEMKAWKNDKFPPEEVRKTLAFVHQKGWDSKLIRGSSV